MRDKDQHLLWESYMESKHTSKDTKDDDHTEKKKGKYDDGDGKTEKCDFVPCKEGTDGSTDDLTDSEKEKLKKHAGIKTEEEHNEEDDDVQEEMDNLEFSAIGRENPEQMVFNAVLSWMRADTEGLTTPEDYEGYSMSTAFDDAKEFIKDALQDISFSEIKAHLTDTVQLNDPEEMAFQQSVDDDIRRDDSRLADMPPREPGV